MLPCAIRCDNQFKKGHFLMHLQLLLFIMRWFILNKWSYLQPQHLLAHVNPTAFVAIDRWISQTVYFETISYRRRAVCFGTCVYFPIWPDCLQVYDDLPEHSHLCAARGVWCRQQPQRIGSSTVVSGQHNKEFLIVCNNGTIILPVHVAHRGVVLYILCGTVESQRRVWCQGRKGPRKWGIYS